MSNRQLVFNGDVNAQLVYQCIMTSKLKDLGGSSSPLAADGTYCGSPITGHTACITNISMVP